jgi:hypothetical protein
MEHVVDRPLWRRSFVGALQLLGQAAVRLPFGVSDPVLCGAAAVELYTGSLWPATAIEVFGVDRRLLATELFALGCHWCQRPRETGSGLWHPGLQIGIDIVEECSPRRRPGVRSTLAVAIDLELPGPAEPEPVSLKIVAIEDLIVEEAVHSLTQGRASREATQRAHALVGLGQAGVGGRFRWGYLQRRLAWETGGEIVLDAPSSALDGDDDVTARMTTLTRMRTPINAWHLRCGMSQGIAPAYAVRERGASRPHAVRSRNDQARRAGERSTARANVIPFDICEPVLPRQGR